MMGFPLTEDAYRKWFVQVWTDRGKPMGWIRDKWQIENPDKAWKDVE